MITVLNRAPTSNHPNNFTTASNGNENITWYLYDDFLGSRSFYRVWANDSNNQYYIWQDWTQWTNDTNLNILVNRSAPIRVNYTIEYNDTNGVFGIPDSVFVNVTELLPSCITPGNIITPISDNATIGWILQDDFGGGYYRVWTNDTNDNPYVWQDWTDWSAMNNTLLNVTINRTVVGDFYYAIELKKN